jgi:hypothetical protein
MTTKIWAPASLLVFVLAISAACAGGGIYIDNLKITNNGKEVFSDALDSGKLVGWTKMSDTTWIPDGPNTQKGTMLLNKHIFCAATAYHSLSAKDLGVVELSADVYCTPPDEQYDQRVKKCGCVTYFTLYSGSSERDIQATIKLNPCQSSYQLAITSAKSREPSVYSKLPVLAPATWSTIKFRLDPTRATATLSLDGKAIISAPYEPEQFQSLREIGLCTGLGDGSRRTD